MNKRLLRSSDAYLLSFLVPAIVMLVIFFARGIFPFGEESFLRTDMYHQYAPFFSEFQYKLQHGGSLLYSWDIGLGVNFTALYAYYLASPLNLLLLLCPKGLVLEFMAYLVVLKIALCGLTATIYFRHHFRRINFSCTLFGLLYAMSGYIAAYSWNIMWLDCIILFPLVLLGAEKLFRGESPLLYVVALGLSIFSNYYISIMTCLFLAIYFLCQIALEGRKGLSSLPWKCGNFLLFSLLAGALAAVTLLPEIYALQSTASGSIHFPETVKQYFSVVEMLARHMMLVDTEQGLDHWPNIYCGTLLFLLIPMYFMNPRIEIRRKTVYALLLLLFYMSFSLNLLNFIWHGLHYPNSLPCRQGYLYVLCMLSMGYEAYLKRKYISSGQLGFAFFLSVAFIFLCQKEVTDDAFRWEVFYVTLLFVAIYYALLYLEKGGKLGYNLLVFGMLVTVGLESAINMAVTSVTTTSRTSYLKDTEDVRKLVSLARSEDESFYRFEKMTRKTKDDGAFMNFPSVSFFSSTAYKHCSDFFRLLGCEASTNAYSITGSTPLVNMLFSVKYDLFSEEPEMPGERALSYVNGSGKIYLYRADYTLPPGFVVTDSFLEHWHLDMGTPALVQNALCAALGTDPVLQEVLGEFEGDDYHFTAEEAGEYYVYVNDKSLKKLRAYMDEDEKLMDNLDRGFFMELGYLSAGESVRLHPETAGCFADCDVFRFDYGALRQIYEILDRETWMPEVYKDTRLSGTVESAEGGMLLTSIPFDRGWSVYLDGEKQEAEQVLDTFIGVRIPAGRHELEMRYFPEGLGAGILISVLGLLLTVACLYIHGHVRVLRRQRQLVERRGRIEQADLAGHPRLQLWSREEEPPVQSIEEGNVVELWKRRDGLQSRRRGNPQEHTFDGRLDPPRNLDSFDGRTPPEDPNEGS